MRTAMSLLSKALIGLVLFSFVLSSAQGAERRSAREKWNHIEGEAIVQAIDKENRQVVLMGSDGTLETLMVGQGVKRFDEIEVGDTVKVDYWNYLVAEFRDPTPEELENPVTVLSQKAEIPEEMGPGTATGAVVKAVVTIEIINRPDMVVTVKGPKGKYFPIPVSDPELITQLKVGEQVIITYSESIVLSLEKAGEAN